MTAIPAKYADRVTADPLYGCWLFADPRRKNNGLDRDGYGTIWGKEGPRAAHLVIYRELVGPIPEGKVLDHVCRRRNCVRPEHLEPVDGAENDRRRSWRYRCRRTHCKNGHDLSTCITTPSEDRGGGGRLCRVCQGPEKQ